MKAGKAAPSLERTDLPFTVALGLLAAMSATAVDIVIPVSPSVEGAFAISPENAQLVVTAYIAGMALGLIPIGTLSDRYGRRPVFLVCVALFVLLGAAMALPLSFPALLGLRFAQGLVGASGPALSRAIVRDLNLPDSGTRLMALITAVLSLAPLFGPLAGSLLGSAIGWRAPFWISAVYGLVTLAALASRMPETRKQTSLDTPFRQLSSAFGTIARSRQAKTGIALFTLPFIGYFAVLTSLSQVMHDLHGVSPDAFGLFFAFSAISYFLGAMIARRLLSGFPSSRVLGLGMAMLAITGIGCMFLVTRAHPPAPALWGAASAFMFGMAICLPITTMAALGPLAGSAGVGASVLGAFQIGIGTLGSFASAKFYNGDHRSMCAAMAASALGAALLHLRCGHMLRSRDMRD